MARVIALGRIKNAKGTFTRGDGIEGSEADLQPLVDVGAAKWHEEPAWTLSVDPETYLERYPDGPNAPLAREVIGEDEEE